MGTLTPKKLNGLPAMLIAKTDATTITIAAKMVLTLMMTVITVTMTVTPGVTIV